MKTLWCRAAFVVCLGVSALASAQEVKPTEAPAAAPPAAAPAGDSSQAGLKAQVEKFYGLLVAGKARQAEALVCEESKDRFYSMNKSTPRSFDVRQLTLGKDGKSASVITMLEDEYPMGFERKLMKMPMPSQWRFDGQWCYYLAKETGIIDTPFGKMDLRATSKSDPNTVLPTNRPPMDAAALSNMVTFSRKVLHLADNADGRDQIEISNGLPGAVSFQITCPNIPGLTCRTERKSLPSGQKTNLVVELSFKGTPIAKNAEVLLWLMPFGSVEKFRILPPQAPANSASPAPGNHGAAPKAH